MAESENRELSASEVASLGGIARAEKLTPEERREIAQRAADARWNVVIPKATHAGELHIGDIPIPCAVLDNKTRVLTQRGFSMAVGRYKNPKKGTVVELPVFLSASNLKPYIDEDLARSSTPIKFRLAEGSGGMDGNIALGYRAELLPKVCNVYLQAQQEGNLLKSQEHIAERCLILLNGLATVGIIALVDEATGFQEERDKLALQAILDRYLLHQFAAWAKRFPDDFYKQIFSATPLGVEGHEGESTAVCGRVHEGVGIFPACSPHLGRIGMRNPRDDKGNRKVKHHQFLTEDIGHPALAQHLYGVTGLMRVANDWDQLIHMVNVAYPKRNERDLFRACGRNEPL